MPQYHAIEKRFEELKKTNKLNPLLNKLESAYMKCTYSHGQHTSRSNTCYTQGHCGIYDHIIYTPEKLRVTELLEIPLES